MTRIRCTFRPQAWVRDNAIDVDAEGETTWETDVATLPKPHSYESDELRTSAEAPEWVRDWSGPFEVEYEPVAEQGDDLDPDALEAARKAVEDVLIDFRDSRIGILGRGNGFVVREADGSDSSVMRLGTPEGLSIGIKAYLAALEGRSE